jgi:hypothetical protein
MNTKEMKRIPGVIARFFGKINRKRLTKAVKNCISTQPGVPSANLAYLADFQHLFFVEALRQLFEKHLHKYLIYNKIKSFFEKACQLFRCVPPVKNLFTAAKNNFEMWGLFVI